MRKRSIKQATVMMFMVMCISCMSYAVTQYNSYKGLQMYGYQGWFNCEGDGADKKWTHYSHDGKFTNGFCCFDFWPDVSEYTKTYKTPFKFSNGSSAYVFSSYDAQTVDVHFKWMRDYGQDGAFQQRFTHNVRTETVKNHYMKVFDSAVLAANKYDRALSIRYDITDCDRDDYKDLLADLDELNSKYDFFGRTGSQTFLHHNGKPLIAFGGVGWQDNGGDISDVGYLREARYIIDGLKSRGYSILIRVPAHWRVKGGQLVTSSANQAEFYKQLKRCDIVMPWHVGHYYEDSYLGTWPARIDADIDWCTANGLDYVPVVWPGFSWYNLQDREATLNSRPRNKGSFYWMQASRAINVGAKMLFLAQFDEIDEGTQFFKCVNSPPVASLSKFVGYESGIKTDHYLWLAGESGRMLRGEKPYTTVLPVRGASSATCHIDIPTGSVTRNVGDTLAVTVSASDSDGVDRVKIYTNGTEYAVSDASAPFEFNLPLPSAGTFTLTAQVRDLLGNYTVSDNSRTLTVGGTPPKTTNFISVAAHDGYVSESSSTSNVGGTNFSAFSTGSALRVGDTGAKKQQKSIVSFDTSSLPDNAVITAATLKLKCGAILGTPSVLGAMSVAIKNTSTGFNNSLALQNADFEAAASSSGVGTLAYPSGSNVWVTSVLNTNGTSRIAKTNHTQFRISFATGDDGDIADDYFGFYSGEAANTADRPVLEVTYQ